MNTVYFQVILYKCALSVTQAKPKPTQIHKVQITRDSQIFWFDLERNKMMVFEARLIVTSI